MVARTGKPAEWVDEFEDVISSNASWKFSAWSVEPLTVVVQIQMINQHPKGEGFSVLQRVQNLESQAASRKIELVSVNTEATTLGMQIIQILTKQLNGQYTYKRLNQGTEFVLTFKKAEIKGSASSLV